MDSEKQQMQVRFAIEPQLRRAEFVERAQFFEPELVREVEPAHLSKEAREYLALCNPTLPQVFNMLAPFDVADDAAGDVSNAPVWEITINPNAYATLEIIEMWAKEFGAHNEKSGQQSGQTEPSEPAQDGQTVS